MKKALAIAEEKSLENPTVRDIRQLMSDKKLRNAVENLLELSTMTEPQKQFIKSLFIKGESKKTAIRKAFGKDLGYREEILSRSIMKTAPVQEFVKALREIYVKAAPLAIITELDLMLSSKDEKVRLVAAQSVQKKAGLDQASQKSGDLPVQVVINMPGAKTENKNLTVIQEPANG